MRSDYVPDYRHCLLPYVQWFQDDFLGGIRGMKAQEIGIYTVLLNEMYNRGVALDQSDERLARMCGADVRVFKRVLSDLIDDGKLIKLDCGLWNLRCENAFTSRAEMLKRQSEAGKSSAKKRRKNSAALQPPLNSHSTSVEPISEAQISEERKEEEPIGSLSETGSDDKPKGRKREVYSAEFETFWASYPRKLEKQEALKAFVKARAKVDLGVIVAGAKAYSAECAGKDPQFIRHASKWLNAASWENVSEATAAASAIPITNELWDKRLKFGRTKNQWQTSKWGPAPGKPGCMVPCGLIQPEDGAGWREWEQAA